MTDRPHDPAIEILEAVDGLLRHSVTVHLVTAAPNRKILPMHIKPGLRRRSLHHLHAFRHDFRPDIVTQQNSDFQHGATP